MKIVIDDKIPYIRGVLEPFATVAYLPGNKINAQAVKNVDALIIRTRTICNRQLLQDSSVKFIASATIGIDHIDKDYCQKVNIQWANASGCNAESVNQYIASALLSYALKKRINITEKTIGIVGVGNVGKKVARLCNALGMPILLNDPPRVREEALTNFVSIKEIQQRADIITFHVPLTTTGKDETHHLVNPQFMDRLEKQPLLINTARGEVFDTEAIKNGLKRRKISDVIIDCWENEPNIDLPLFKKSLYGTPHIAGYSRDGKANGTKAVVQAVSHFFNLGIDDWQPKALEEPKDPIILINGDQRRDYSIFAEAILSTYDIETESDTLKNAPNDFELLRGNYPARREFSAYSIQPENIKKETLQKLSNLGFQIMEQQFSCLPTKPLKIF